MKDYRTSNDFFESDLILRNYLEHHLIAENLSDFQQMLHSQGKVSANFMDHLSRRAEQNPPRLVKRTKFGSDINEVEFDPAYWQLMDIAAKTEMFYLKYHPDNKGKYEGSRHRMGFALGQLYGMSELGQYCPHCMTDGAAYLLEKYGSEKDKQRLLPRLGAREGAKLFSGAMFLTEKSGGSDVGANLCTAEKIQGEQYRLNGEKWFCSNVNADVIMVLARTGPLEEGTGGLSLFLVEKRLPNGGQNPMEIIRLKGKLGVRSMATAEVRFQNTQGKRLGEEGEGFKVMTRMINMSRNYNSVAALAGYRRAMAEVWQYLNHRLTFGKRAVEHALVREKFGELGATYVATFLLVWRGLRAMDAAEKGDERERDLLRILTPMAKWWSAEQSVYAVRECMELMGGNGYIEDFLMPKILRDVNVLPIWEGSGNIIVLDILRAARKSGGLAIVFEMIEEAAGQSDKHGKLLAKQLSEIKKVWKGMGEMEGKDEVEATAKPLFERVILLLQISLLIEEKQAGYSDRFDIALRHLTNRLDNTLGKKTPLSLEKVEELIGWEY